MNTTTWESANENTGRESPDSNEGNMAAAVASGTDSQGLASRSWAVKSSALWNRFMTDNSKNVLTSLADQGVVSAAGFATSVLIGRFISPAELGVYYLALSLILFMRGMQEQTITTPYMIYCHRYKGQELAQYNGSCFLHQLAMAALTVFVVAAMAVGASFGWANANLLPTLAVLSVFVPLLLMREFIRQFCFAHMRMRTALGVDVVVSTLQIAGLFGLATSGTLSSSNAFVVIGISCGVAILIWYWRARPVVEFQLRRFVPDWRRNWSFGKWAVAGQLVGSSSTYILPWILVHARGADATGMFAAGFTLVGVSNVFMMGMANYLTPKSADAYANQGASGLSRVLKKTALLFLVTLGCFLLVVLIAGGAIASLVYGEAYADLQRVMVVLAVTTLVNSFSVVAGNGLYVMDRMRANFIADICLTSVTVIAAVALTYPYGVLGAAFAGLIGMLAGTLARSFILLRLLRAELTTVRDA